MNIHVRSFAFGGVLILVLIGVPLILTTLNIVSAIRRKNVLANWWAVPALIIGLLYSILLFALNGYPDWHVAITRRASESPGIHTPLASWHLLTILVFYGLSIVAFVLLRFFKELPPIISALCISLILFACVVAIVYTVQLISMIPSELSVLFWILYSTNVILLYVRAIRQKTIELTELMRENPVTYKSQFLNYCLSLLTNSTRWMFASFILMFPLICIVIIILALFGQQPDAIIRVFTDTSGWTFSQQVAPPDIVLHSNMHYLCTVAANGNPRLVKPLRYGKRYACKIIVNRQLCVANAFEDYIAEKTPRIHKVVRRFYDQFGYPLSKHITTKKRANVTYVLMKPLEWIFVLFLYTVDKRPENRIARQYL